MVGGEEGGEEQEEGMGSEQDRETLRRRRESSFREVQCCGSLHARSDPHGIKPKDLSQGDVG